MDEENNFLLSVSSGNILSMWNVKTKTRVWKKEIPDPVISISVNPFVKTNACLPTDNGWIYFINGSYAVFFEPRFENTIINNLVFF